MKQQLQHQLLSNQQQICVRSNFERKNCISFLMKNTFLPPSVIGARIPDIP